MSPAIEYTSFKALRTLAKYGALVGPRALMLQSFPGEDRASLVRTALRLEVFTIVWTILEAAMSVSVGLGARSLALFGFGLDSAIETLSAAVVYRRWRAEQRGVESADQLERPAVRVIGVTFLVLASYIGYESISDLIKGTRPDPSRCGRRSRRIPRDDCAGSRQAPRRPSAQE
jgi:hypothetical protein